MKTAVALFCRLSFLLLFFTLLQAPLNAKRVLPEDRIEAIDGSKTKKQQFWSKSRKYKFQKRKKRRPNPKKFKNGAGPLWPAMLLWYVLLPIGIISLFVLAFMTTPVSLPFWYAALGASVLWLAASGIVFFPIQYVGLLGGMALILYSLIFSGSFLLLTAGIALVLTAILALGYMVLMFTMGTRKYQPKYK